MNEIVKLVLTLVLITTIATALLSFTYGITKPVIDETRARNFQKLLQEIFPNSDSFELVEDRYDVFQGDRLIGYVAITEAFGYSSDIEILIGTTPEGIVEGVAIISQLETPGLGSRVTEEEFLNQFRGRTKEELELVKYGGQIDAITGATMSSQSVTDAVRIKVEELS